VVSGYLGIVSILICSQDVQVKFQLALFVSALALGAVGVGVVPVLPSGAPGTSEITQGIPNTFPDDFRCPYLLHNQRGFRIYFIDTILKTDAYIFEIYLREQPVSTSPTRPKCVGAEV